MNAPKVKMMGDNVLVKEKDGTKVKTATGIEFVQNTNSAVKIGEVIAVGSGKVSEDGHSFNPPGVNVGDNVMYMYGEDVFIGSEPYCIVMESDIKVVLEK